MRRKMMTARERVIRRKERRRKRHCDMLLIQLRYIGDLCHPFFVFFMIIYCLFAKL